MQCIHMPTMSCILSSSHAGMICLQLVVVRRHREFLAAYAACVPYSFAVYGLRNS